MRIRCKKNVLHYFIANVIRRPLPTNSMTKTPVYVTMKSRGNLPSYLQPPCLEAVLVEQILQTYASQASLNELGHIISLIWPYLSTNGLKKYLFYLIEYYLIKYHGQSQIFGLTDEGLDLLRLIKLEKENSKRNIENSMIILK
jgi:hypothetical protein